MFLAIVLTFVLPLALVYTLPAVVPTVGYAESLVVVYTIVLLTLAVHATVDAVLRSEEHTSELQSH